MPIINIISTHRVIYKGRAESVIVPGDMGVFEIMAFHKNIMSRLLRGDIEVDGRHFPIVRGIVKVEGNTVTAVVEEE